MRKPPLGLEQRLLRLALVGHVAGDLGEADQLALVVVDAVDDDARPEARCRPCARASLRPRTCLRGVAVSSTFCGQARLAVLLGVEGGEMLADDLFGLEALDPLGAGVPAGHEALRVEHVDGVVDDRLDEQPERDRTCNPSSLGRQSPPKLALLYTARRIHLRDDAQPASVAAVAWLATQSGDTGDVAASRRAGSSGSRRASPA